MSAAMIGAAVGLALAAVDLVLLRLLASRVELPETKTVLNVTGATQFVLLPLMGWFAAPFLIGD